MLHNVFALTGLRPVGKEVDDAFFVDDLPPIISLSYSGFVKTYNPIEGSISQKEHIAFLLYWMCRFIFCSPSVKIVHIHLKLAVLLTRGEKGPWAC